MKRLRLRCDGKRVYVKKRLELKVNHKGVFGVLKVILVGKMSEKNKNKKKHLFGFEGT